MNDGEVANTIWQQMNAIDKNLVWCMGVSKKFVIKNGLQFRVNGLSFKGIVEICVNGKDLYDVSLFRTVRSYYVNELYGAKQYTTENKLVEKIGDVFVGDLMPLLEEKIERREK